MQYSKDRIAICNECEHYKPETYTCKQCGCFMLAKTKIPMANCPIGKWKSIYEGQDIKSAFGRRSKIQ